MAAKPGWLFFLPWSLESVGGVNRVVIELCREMHRQGEYRPFVLIDSWPDSHARFVDKDFYTEIHYRIREPLTESNTIKATLLFLMHLPVELTRLKLMFKRYNIRVLNPHYFTMASSLLFTYRKVFGKSVRMVISLHGTDLFTLENISRIRSYILLFMLKRVDAVVTCSEGLKRKLIELGSLSDSAVCSIPNGFSSDMRSKSTVKQLESSDVNLPEKPYILSVGTFDQVKGFDTLIRAFSLLAVDRPDIDLVLVGRSASSLPAIFAQIQKYSLHKRVHIFTDVAPQSMPLFYRKASIFVLASRHEAFGIVLLEAAVNRVPIISTRTMGGTEIISDDVDGILVGIDDIGSLRDAIADFLENSSKAGGCAQRMYKKVLDKYTWEKACMSYASLINRDL